MRRLLIWSGLAAPLLFVGALILARIFYPSFSQVQTTVSELMAIGSPAKPMMDLVFFAYAILVALFGFAMVKREETNGHIAAGSMLIFSGILGMIMILFFPSDMPSAAVTITGIVHVAIVLSIALLTTGSMVFAAEKQSLAFKAYSRLTAFIYVPSWIITGIGFVNKSSIIGALERFSILLFLAWLFIFAATELLKDWKTFLKRIDRKVEVQDGRQES